jgi:16S rRNA (adenine1518-N6/adenine1519-N6)-dimethyltransferase
MPNQPRLRKALGQHHLRDGARCLRAVEYLQPAGRLVVEIGPGGGVLTRELLRAGAKVAAWEIDPAWAIELSRRLRSPRLAIVVGDALELPWERLPAGSLVAGNLPFSVATPILEGFLLRGLASPRAVLLVQDEVAQRLVAAPGSRAYGFLTVTTAAVATISVLERLSPGSFRPPPKVHGAMIGVARRPAPIVPVAEMAAFRETVSQAFSHRRKTLANSLGAARGRASATAAIEAAGLDPGRRAETLTLDEFVRLARSLRAGAGDREKKNL